MENFIQDSDCMPKDWAEIDKDPDYVPEDWKFSCQRLEHLTLNLLPKIGNKLSKIRKMFHPIQCRYLLLMMMVEKLVNTYSPNTVSEIYNNGRQDEITSDVPMSLLHHQTSFSGKCIENTK